MFGNQLPVVEMLLLLHRICILDLHEISIQNELSDLLEEVFVVKM